MRVPEQGTELAHERFEVAPGEQLHHVVEGPFLRDAEVEHLDRVRRAQCRGCLRLAFEATECELGFIVVARAEDFGAHQLDRGVAREQAMFGAPDFAHPAVPELVRSGDSCRVPAPLSGGG